MAEVTPITAAVDVSAESDDENALKDKDIHSPDHADNLQTSDEGVHSPDLADSLQTSDEGVLSPDHADSPQTSEPSAQDSHSGNLHVLITAFNKYYVL